jgi:hypothetical protein
MPIAPDTTTTPDPDVFTGERYERLKQAAELLAADENAQRRSSMGDVLQLTSCALLAYPDCHGPRHNDGD